MISEGSPASLRSVPVYLFTVNPFLSQLLGGHPLEEESAPQRRESCLKSFLPSALLDRVSILQLSASSSAKDSGADAQHSPHPAHPCPSLTSLSSLTTGPEPGEVNPKD